MGFYVPAPEQQASVKSYRASGIARPAERPLRRSSTRASRSSVLAREAMHAKLVTQGVIKEENQQQEVGQSGSCPRACKRKLRFSHARIQSISQSDGNWQQVCITVQEPGY